MNGLHLAGLMTLASLWGASFLFIRMAVPSFGPFVLMTLRVLLGGGSLWLLTALLRRRADWLPRWRQYVLLGAVNASMPFSLIAAAELVIPASLAAILNGLTPVFTAIVSAAWLGRPVEPKMALGLLFAFTGVVVSVGWSPVELTLWPLLAAGAVALASLLYGIGSNYASLAFPDVDATTMSVGQNMGAALVLLPFALATVPKGPPPADATGAMLALALLCTAAAYQIYFWLLRNVGPTRTTSVTFLVPLFGMLWGRLFLNEPLTVGMFVGLALVFVGIWFMANPGTRARAGEGTGARARAGEQKETRTVVRPSSHSPRERA